MALTRLRPHLAAAVVAALRDRSQTLATAESLTGGLVGATLTDVPGASAVYRGGLIVYATELKAELAGVSAQTLAADGPVAATHGGAAGPRGRGRVRGRLGTGDDRSGRTGSAGRASRRPGVRRRGRTTEVLDEVPGVPEADQVGVQVQELALAGDRSAIRDQTTRAVLLLLLDRLGVGIRAVARRRLGRRDLSDTVPNARSAPTVSERLGTVSACDLLPR